MNRPKRAIAKPSRYQTTSSEDEAPRRPRKTCGPPMTDAEINEDINDLRGILEDNPINNTQQNDNTFPESQTYSQFSEIPINAPTHTYSHQPTYTTLPTTSHTSNNSYNFLNSSIPTHTDRVYNNNITYETQFQQNAEQSNYGSICYPDEMLRSNEKINRSINLIQKRVDGVETELKRMNTLLEKVLKSVKDHQSVPRKPAILPISSLTEMDDFENIDEDRYTDVVNYFHYIGGFNLKEAINLCLKEAVKDSLTLSFTWWGREGEQKPLYNARIIIAIYEAMCNNQHFPKPTRSEFQVHAKEALRGAKERARSKLRGPRAQVRNARNRDFWSDNREPEENDQ